MAEDIAEEKAILARLALAHKLWRDRRPPPPKRSPEEREAEFSKMIDKTRNPEPKDVVAIREVPNDPLAVEIGSQLSIVGWRLYAKGGSALMLSTYINMERDAHPGFVTALRIAWRGIGLPNDPRGVWSTKTLL